MGETLFIVFQVFKDPLLMLTCHIKGPYSLTGIGWEGGLLVAKAARVVQRRDKQVNTIVLFVKMINMEFEDVCFTHTSD